MPLSLGTSSFLARVPFANGGIHTRNAVLRFHSHVVGRQGCAMQSVPHQKYLALLLFQTSLTKIIAWSCLLSICCLHVINRRDGVNN